jgi:hypothetical protein
MGKKAVESGIGFANPGGSLEGKHKAALTKLVSRPDGNVGYSDVSRLTMRLRLRLRLRGRVASSKNQSKYQLPCVFTQTC